MVAVRAYCVAAVAVVLSSLSVGSAKVDQTLALGAGGCKVIEAVLSKLTMSNVFPDDNGFLRRIAYAETRAGRDLASAGRRGPWDVSSEMFASTQESNPVLSSFKTNIANSTHLRGVGGEPLEWSATNLQDLDRPLYSAIAARLYLELTLNNGTSGAEVDLPVRLSYQAVFWANQYNPAENKTGLAEKFLQRTNELDDECACKSSIDMAFVMDMSGSVGSIDFGKAKRFVAQIVNNFTIAPNRTRVGLITYSTQPYVQFGLNSFENSKDVLSAINQTRYRGGWTRTGRALRAMLDDIFNLTEKSPSTTRIPTTQPPTTTAQATTAMETTPPPPPPNPGFGPDIGGNFPPRPIDPQTTRRPTTIPPTTQIELAPMEIKSRVAIVVTDGRAQDDVLPPSLEAHDLGITMFAIGVGKNIKLSELQEIASDPDRAHIFTVDDYTAIDSIRASVRQRSCLASARISFGQPITGDVALEESTFVVITLPSEEATLSFEVIQGSMTLYTSFTAPNPSEAIHDQKMEVSSGQRGSLHVSKDPSRQRQTITSRERRQAESKGESTTTLYMSIYGQESRNRFILQSQKSDPSLFFPQSGQARSSATIACFVIPAIVSLYSIISSL